MAKALIFDLDGTLVDSAPDLNAVANRLLAERGLEPIDLATLTGFIGHGIPQTVKWIFQHLDVAMSDEQLAEAADRFIEIYSANPAELSIVYPGAFAALGELSEKGHKLAICTNKAETVAIKVVKQLGLDKYMDALVGGGRTAQKKPHPAPLFACADYMKVATDQIIYIGDSETDAATAMAANIPFVLYTEGYRKQPPEALKHDALFDDFAELPGIIEKLESR